jgi:FkbM family methyltransferase
VGTSFASPNSIQFLKRNPRGFVVGFEPDPRMYFSIFSAEQFANNLWLLDESNPSATEELNKRRMNTRLDDVFKQGTEEYISTDDMFDRYIIIPAAVCDEDSIAILNFSSHHGSSSLHAMSEKVGRNHPVKTIELHSVIDMIPEKFEYLDHLKIDAEGMDHKVVLSAKDRIDRFVVVSSEMRLDSLMNSLGFDFLTEQPGSFSYINRSKKHVFDTGVVDYKIRV